MVDTSKYEVISDILIAVDVEEQDGNFHFEHEWKEGTDPNFEIEQTVTMSGDDLWMIDLRANDFKSVENYKEKSRVARDGKPRLHGL